MSPLLTAHRAGFPPGTTAVTTLDDASGIALSVVRLREGERRELRCLRESCWLVLGGRVALRTGTASATVARSSLFDDAPAALLAPAGAQVSLVAELETELLMAETANTRAFEPRLYLPAETQDEHRGKGLVHDAAYRFVRTVFDLRNAPPEAELVLGEVVNFPGRWSSYPPHHHAQPELYHYRFSDPRGYGHAELGDDVYKVRNFDTLRITGGLDHPQCAAPGYAMYYAWFVRHLPGSKYDQVDFHPDHAWTMREGATAWWPRGVPRP